LVKRIGVFFRKVVGDAKRWVMVDKKKEAKKRINSLFSIELLWMIGKEEKKRKAPLKSNWQRPTKIKL
jgi:hypothetical protein